jgi:uncharacterized metal-binding protein YceD (DUF177 family)
MYQAQQAQEELERVRCVDRVGTWIECALYGVFIRTTAWLNALQDEDQDLLVDYQSEADTVVNDSLD